MLMKHRPLRKIRWNTKALPVFTRFDDTRCRSGRQTHPILPPLTTIANEFHALRVGGRQQLEQNSAQTLVEMQNHLWS